MIRGNRGQGGTGDRETVHRRSGGGGRAGNPVDPASEALDAALAGKE